jgi:hypothetical protein
MMGEPLGSPETLEANMLSEKQVIEMISEKTGLNVRPRTLEKFAAAGLIGKPVLIGISDDKTFWPDDTPLKFANAAKKMAQSEKFKSTLVHRRFERDGNKITMYSTYDHSDIYRQAYEMRMSGERYSDKEKDLMPTCLIPIPLLASMTPEQRYELDNNKKARRKFLEEHPLLRTSTARI